MSLLDKHCVPCEGSVAPLNDRQIAGFLSTLSGNWGVEEDAKLSRTFPFPDFRTGMQFVNRVATLAEEEGHHPDITIHYHSVHIELTTHAIGGLSENDFILASKIEALPQAK